MTRGGQQRRVQFGAVKLKTRQRIFFRFRADDVAHVGTNDGCGTSVVPD